jgi:prepilin-type N-terminal cleavage/methylation domain-containing protein
MKIRRQDGFSILEVMVGLVIFSTGLLLLSSMMMVSLKGNKWSNKTTQTVQLIRDKIEDFRNESPADMVDGSDSKNGIHRSWKFQDVSANLKKVTVIVHWVDERETVQACTTSTYIEI